MQRISGGEIQREWNRVHDLAIAEPVAITNNGRDEMVLMTTEEYQRLKRRDREVLALEDFTEADIQAIANTDAPASSAAFDHEMEE